MKINGLHYRSVWVADNNRTIEILDQTKLPFKFNIIQLETISDAATAVGTRNTFNRCCCRLWDGLAMRENPSDDNLHLSSDILNKTRPTILI